MITDKKLTELRALKKTSIRVPSHLQTPYINALEDAAPDLLGEIERLRDLALMQGNLIESGIFVSSTDYSSLIADRDRYRDMAVRLGKNFKTLAIRHGYKVIDPDIAALLKEIENE